MLAFADIVLAAANLTEMHVLQKEVVTEAEKTGLKLNVDKMQCMGYIFSSRTYDRDPTKFKR